MEKEAHESLLIEIFRKPQSFKGIKAAVTNSEVCG